MTMNIKKATYFYIAIGGGGKRSSGGGSECNIPKRRSKQHEISKFQHNVFNEQTMHFDIIYALPIPSKVDNSTLPEM